MTSVIINILALDDQLEVEWADGHALPGKVQIVSFEHAWAPQFCFV